MVYLCEGMLCNHTRKEVLTHATTWMNLKLLLAKEATYCGVPLKEISRIPK
jgi:hypothetical protein